ncbi:MAG: bacillithiol biosynthesis BshC, partial [Candidatus Latescibacteria bacterium]|nr:bacillithiol biosynthesis BshC [Candidatus Latescibacterota bacterium]
LRPICQDAIMPAAALICGPGERLYLEQIKPLYTHFGVNRSIPWPRASFSVIDSRILRNARKELIPIRRLFHDVENARTGLARDTFPEEAESKFDSLAHEIETGFSSLAKSISSIDPTLVNSVKKDAGRVLHIIGEIRKRALRAHKASLAVSEKRLMSASYSLMPGNGPQERWFGIDSILPILSGEGFGEFLELTSPNEERHRIIMPDG